MSRYARKRNIRETFSSHVRLAEGSDLEKASIILAAKGVVNDLQSILVKLSDLSAKNVGSLVDNISSQFSPNQASEFESSVNEALQSSIDSIKSTKDIVNNSILVLDGQAPANDMAQDEGEEDTTFDIPETPANPEGRVKKESRQNKKDKILESHGRKVLTNESISHLMKWLFENASAKMSPVEFKQFSSHAIEQAIANPQRMAGWIATKRDSVAYAAQTMKPQISPSARASNLVITMEGQKKR